MRYKRFYRVPELSRITGIPRASLYAAVHRKEIKSMRLATAIYIPREDAVRLIGEDPIEDAAAEKTAASLR